jgi:hypothetical protein
MVFCKHCSGRLVYGHSNRWSSIQTAEPLAPDWCLFGMANLDVHNLVMKSALCCLLFLPGSLTAQTPTDKLASTLMTLKGDTSLSSIRQQVVDDVMLLAWQNNPPSRSTVVKFVDDLTNVLVGKDLPVTPVSQISILIAESLHSAVWKDSSFFASLDHLRKALIGLGVVAPEAQVRIVQLPCCNSPRPSPAVMIDSMVMTAKESTQES